MKKTGTREIVETRFRSEWKTAKEMALTPHNLSRDGMTAKCKDGNTWKWADHFNVWAKV